MQRWAKGRGGSSRFVELAVHMWQTATLYGEDPAVPYSIAAHETRNGNFGGVLDATFHNWGGIKTAGGGANDDPDAHARFPSDRVGATAVVQHAARYAGLELPDDIIVDPRYRQVTGRADHLEDPGWRWAGPDHGTNVARLVRMMRLA
jgi:N-acetylmuramoyl-L-alanine amidase